ncbi:hypothetical protein Q644_15265 [Brucella intermedia 229E]|uniref:Uncharacterized protein n=2 Tax=Brucella TaxID=234 RepID=U4VCC0_9HYPH|nr:hypothetical protein Q644_15265 [Brucella intermedia 229E]
MATLKVFAFAAETIMFSSSAGSKDNTLPENIVAIPVVDETMKASVLQIVTMQGRNLPRSIAAFLDFLGQSVIER